MIYVADTVALVHYLLKDHNNYVVSPINVAIVQQAKTITDVPELHDRLIAATAVHYNAPLLTSDHKISASQFVQTIW